MKGTLQKIAKVISPTNPLREWEGGYLHTSKGEVVMTDGRRMLLISDCEVKDKDYFIDKEGEEVNTFNFPKYEKYSDDGYYMWSQSFEIDLGSLITDKGWMKKGCKQRVLFRSKGYKVVSKTEAFETDKGLGLFNTSFLADFLRVVRTYYKNRAKSIKVTMYLNAQGVLPLHILTEDKKFHYIVMPIQYRGVIDNETTEVVELVKEKTIF